MQFRDVHINALYVVSGTTVPGSRLIQLRWAVLSCYGQSGGFS